MRSAMYSFFLLVILFSRSVVSEQCMIFNFENGLKDFNNEGQICATLDMWNLENYSVLSMDGFHQQSSVFAFPLSSLSCMTSPVFEMQTGGTLEINLYLKPNVKMYQFFVIVQKYMEGDMDAAVLTKDVHLTQGWQSINIAVDRLESFLGRVVFLGIADPTSLLVDSIRYIPPSKNETECQIYKDVEVKDPEEDKKPSYSIFYMFKMGIVKIFN